MSGKGRMGVGASTGWIIGTGYIGAGTGVWMGACKWWSYICEGGTFRFAMGFESSFSSSEPSGSGCSSKLIPPSSSYSGSCWCERMVSV